MEIKDSITSGYFPAIIKASVPPPHQPRMENFGYPSFLINEWDLKLWLDSYIISIVVLAKYLPA